MLPFREFRLVVFEGDDRFGIVAGIKISGANGVKNWLNLRRHVYAGDERFEIRCGLGVMPGLEFRPGLAVGGREIMIALTRGGRYRHDLNAAETLETRLGVFSNFRPKIPEQFREAPFVFLANIDPRLQLDVLNQMHDAKLVACDTMNFWIESRRNELLELLGRVDILLVNDGEARQLTEQYNLVKAARWVLERGPKYVVIKKGERGAYMFSAKSVFFTPAYPLESVFDPTGAGDAFAGGFIGYLASTGRNDEQAMRRAVVYGSTMGSFAVERFSIDRLLEITRPDIASRLEEFRALVAFEEELDT